MPSLPPTNPDATPDLDGWGWDSFWSAQDWLTWHAAVKARDGLDVANARFLAAWNQQSFGASPLDARSFDSGFREYARANGFLSGLYGNGASIAQPLGLVSDVASASTQVGAGIQNTGTLLKWLLPVAVLGVVGVYAWPILKPAIRRALKA